ncbi:MAG: DUF4260 family protein [Chitinophagaceae bacterium]|nr:MAG: DUF4260 family protein [Chitinophagaceae bacterium]
MGLYYFSAEWWWYLLLVLGPDVSMIGYAAGNRVGAALYNIFHHKGIALSLAAAGLLLNSEALILTGIVLFGHSSMDRMFGYGLKYNEGFAFTHLGKIGMGKNQLTKED